ncbi:MAG: amidohydrolase [Gammaproteobacteria bacterium]|jgi:predicted amidohydrolase YtcJ|nr:amidohydrolase [Gammaproteobacteria bacterium]
MTLLKNRLSPKLSILLFTIFLLSGCGKDEADEAKAVEGKSEEKIVAASAYVNGRVYTVDTDNSWARAIAVTDGKIVAVGSNADIAKHVDKTTKVYNLKGKMLMPGIHDMHAHPMQGGEKFKFQCSFPFTVTVDEIVVKLTECASNTPKGEWIRGGQWAMELMESSTVPHKKILDAITTEHPVYLGDSTVHAAWLNSKALEVLGINADTPDPVGGVIVREPGNKEPTGILIDNAAYDVLKKMPIYSVEQYEASLKWAMMEMNKVGITAVKDAITDRNTLIAYKNLDLSNRLTMKVSTSITWKMRWTDTREQELESLEIRADYATENVGTDFIKIMLDGVPPTHTAAMLDPYVADKIHGDNFRGKLIHSEEQLTEDMIYLDGRGLTVKIHSVGDRAVRVALNAIEAARKANAGSSMMHEISHAGLIHPDDIPRFKELNVTAEISPILWYPTELLEIMVQMVSEDLPTRYYPIRSLHEAGAHMVYGSDWPSVVPDPNPWPGIEAMVSRKDPYGVRPGVMWQEQGIDLVTALRIFTINGAISGKHADKTGSIEVGKSADFIILDRNIFQIPIDEISDTKILSTFVSGKEVYSSK